MKRDARVSFPLLIISVLLLGSTPLSAFDWDWGGNLKNTTAYLVSNDSELTQEDELSLWFDGKEYFGSSTLGLTAQASYLFTNERAYLFDIEILRAKGVFPGALGDSSMVETSVGRFLFTDPTGYILSHAADGASLKLLFPRMQVQIDGAYTGLLLNPSSNIRISDADFSEKFDEEGNTFGPKRLLGQAKLSFTDLGALRRWTFYGLAQVDLREDDPAIETINSQYWGTLLSFAFFRNLYYETFLTVGTSQLKTVEESNAVSLLTGFNIRFLKESWLASSFSLHGLAASPDAPVEDLDIGIDIPFDINQVRPINGPTLGMVVDPGLDSLLTAGFDYSMRPFYGNKSGMLSRIEPTVGMDLFYRIYKWNADWMLLDEESDSWFLGTEYSAGVTWRVFSDLSTSLEGAAFVPGAAWSKDEDTDLMVRFELSASF